MEGEKETKPVIRQWALCRSVKINASKNTDAQYIFMVCERENSKYIEWEPMEENKKYNFYSSSQEINGKYYQLLTVAEA